MRAVSVSPQPSEPVDHIPRWNGKAGPFFQVVYQGNAPTPPPQQTFAIYLPSIIRLRRHFFQPILCPETDAPSRVFGEYSQSCTRNLRQTSISFLREHLRRGHILHLFQNHSQTQVSGLAPLPRLSAPKEQAFRREASLRRRPVNAPPRKNRGNRRPDESNTARGSPRTAQHSPSPQPNPGSENSRTPIPRKAPEFLGVDFDTEA
ncbi:hypothetical protein GQ43DRAFT_84138 [Delitschia confertaspora ATCC 74209]|uniref:Uncharacterized protein n=1 Tax=Delitschia confertaspora ATCC 74209 TaxID=1513339 RepID=A0A9P4JNR3_9PLEO|nr:hypothetical protein GQ43DRAFT_84138 [Delitschia confertaspora ATCC 74209]